MAKAGGDVVDQAKGRSVWPERSDRAFDISRVSARRVFGDPELRFVLDTAVDEETCQRWEDSV